MSEIQTIATMNDIFARIYTVLVDIREILLKTFNVVVPNDTPSVLSNDKGIVIADSDDNKAELFIPIKLAGKIDKRFAIKMRVFLL